MATITLEIVTPKGRALQTSADEVNVPSADGEFGVLPGHLATLAAVRAGIVSYRTGAEWKRCAVGAGFVEVSGGTASEKVPSDRVLVLTEEFVVRDTVDPVVVRTELKDVQVEITKTEVDASDQSTEKGRVAAARLRGLIERENWLAAELELYGDPPPPTMRPYEEFGPSPIDDTAGGAGEDELANVTTKD
ncbi:MAG TPA: ATP synthase F1 subunit epsilon [Polyangiaceae bacterium]|jgi:F-type H+-transporting ATPase subunit epsilon